ncbi:MAG: hypothetical protein ACNA7G_13460 [Methylobacter sp.]
MTSPASLGDSSEPYQPNNTQPLLKPDTKPAYPDFTPSVPGIPESAPAYSHLIKVTAAPFLAGCVLNTLTDNCQCYTNQATPYQVSQEYCRETIKGHRFNPYIKAKTTSKPQPQNQDQNDQTIVLGSINNDSIKHVK